MSRILITGGAGFIGSNLCEYLIKNTSYELLILDKLTYAGNLENLKSVLDNDRVIFIQGDICDNDLVQRVFSKYEILHVIHLAAESHVDNSIKDPSLFVRTNVVGTQSLLESARVYWTLKGTIKTSRFHHVSTDEVYGSLEQDEFFTEESKYLPNSPYSASKASSDHLVRAYHETFGLNTVITNCSNNYGRNQHEEKLIPKVIKCLINNQSIPIYGNGLNERDWLYVEDHCSAIQVVFEMGKAGDVYLIGTRNVKNNLDLIKDIIFAYKEITGQDKSNLITFVEDRLGHDKRYAINPTKLEKELGWSPKNEYNKSIIDTIQFYLQKENV